MDVGHSGGWRIAAGVSVFGLVLLVRGGRVLVRVARWLSPGFAAAQGVDPATETFGPELAAAVHAFPAPALRSLAESVTLPVQALVWGLGPLLSLLLYLILLHVLHEGTHTLLLSAVTGRQPRFGFTGWAATVALPGCYLTRPHYVAAELAPLVLLTAGGLAAVPWTSPGAVPGLPALLLLYAVGSAGDVLTAGGYSPGGTPCWSSPAGRRPSSTPPIPRPRRAGVATTAVQPSPVRRTRRGSDSRPSQARRPSDLCLSRLFLDDPD